MIQLIKACRNSANLKFPDMLIFLEDRTVHISQSLFVHILQQSLCLSPNQALLLGKWKSSLLPPLVGSSALASLCAYICLEQVPDPVRLQHSQYRYGWEALGCSYSPPSFPGVPICVPANPLPHGTCPSTSLVHSSSGDVHACLPPHTLPVVQPQ